MFEGGRHILWVLHAILQGHKLDQGSEGVGRQKADLDRIVIINIGDTEKERKGERRRGIKIKRQGAISEGISLTRVAKVLVANRRT